MSKLFVNTGDFLLIFEQFCGKMQLNTILYRLTRGQDEKTKTVFSDQGDSFLPNLSHPWDESAIIRLLPGENPEFSKNRIIRKESVDRKKLVIA